MFKLNRNNLVSDTIYRVRTTFGNSSTLEGTFRSYSEADKLFRKLKEEFKNTKIKVEFSSSSESYSESELTIYK